MESEFPSLSLLKVSRRNKELNTKCLYVIVACVINSVNTLYEIQFSGE